TPRSTEKHLAEAGYQWSPGHLSAPASALARRYLPSKRSSHARGFGYQALGHARKSVPPGFWYQYSNGDYHRESDVPGSGCPSPGYTPPCTPTTPNRPPGARVEDPDWLYADPGDPHPA